MFIPGILLIWLLFVGIFFAGAFCLLDTAFRRCIPDIFIPGMFIPGILLMSCFLSLFLRVPFLFFRDVAVESALGFDLLIPGMLDMSCCARTGMLATISISANKNTHARRELTLNASMLFIIPFKKFPTKEDSQEKTSSAGTKDLVVVVKTSGRVSVIRPETPKEGTRSEKRY